MNYNLGIEIELTGVTREQVIIALSNYFSRDYNKVISIKYGYIYYTIEDNNGLKWCVKRDTSIHQEVTNNFDGALKREEYIPELDNDKSPYAVELISPVLTEQTIASLFDILTILKAIGGVVNNSCGLHVHIDAPTDVSHTVFLIQKMILEQNYLFEEFGVYGDRQGYCKRLPNILAPIIEQANVTSTEALLDVVYDYLAPGEERSHPRNSARYYGLNLASLTKHNTLEFRFFNGTLEHSEVSKILDWVLHFAYTPTEISNLEKDYKVSSSLL